MLLWYNKVFLHFAVALKYEVGEEGAPKILAMGRGLMAEKIMQLANEKNINIFSSPLLARALYFTGNIGQAISEQLYQDTIVSEIKIFEFPASIWAPTGP